MGRRRTVRAERFPVPFRRAGAGGAARAVVGGGGRAHRAERLPPRADPDACGRGPLRRGEAGGGPVPGPLRPRRVFYRTARPRPGRAERAERRAAAARGRAGPGRGGHQQRALFAAGRCGGPRGAAGAGRGDEAGRPRQAPVRLRGVLHEIGRGNAPLVRPAPRRAGKYRAHRRAVPRPAGAGPHAVAHVPRGRGEGGGRDGRRRRGVVPARVRRRPPAVRPTTSRPRARAAAARAGRHRRRGLGRLLPAGGRHRPARPRTGHSRRSRAGVRGGQLGRVLPAHHRRGPRRARASLRAVSQPRAAANARHRRGRLRHPPGRTAPRRAGTLWPRKRGPDRHLWHAGGPSGPAGHGACAERSRGRRRPHRPHGARRAPRHVGRGAAALSDVGAGPRRKRDDRPLVPAGGSGGGHAAAFVGAHGGRRHRRRSHYPGNCRWSSRPTAPR